MDTKRKLTSAFIKGIDTPDKRIEFYDTIATGMIIRVTKTGYKSFAYRYWYDGSSKQITIGKFGDISLADARKKARDFKQQVSEGKDPNREKKERKKDKPTTFKEAVESYRKHHLPTLKESTKIDYERRIKHLIKGEGKDDTKPRGLDGSRYIKNIKRFEIIDSLNEIGRSAPTQAKRLQALFSGIFKHAKDREWISTNIAQEISIKTKAKRKKGSKKWQNIDLSNDDLIKLWDAFDKHAEPVGSLFKVLLLLGQRSGETRLMKWEDIDFKKQLWTIPASDTKNGVIQHVPLNDMALEILESLKPWSTGKFVFDSPIKPGQPVGSQQKAAARIRDNNDVDDFNIHSLRTTVASRLAGLGVPPQVLSKILNHKKPGEGSMITAIYNKYDYEDEKRKALARWENELQRILEGIETKIFKLG